MTWVKVSDDSPHHPKARRVGLEAWGLYVSGLAYCARELTDGAISADALSDVWPWGGKLGPVVDRLVAAHLWHVEPDGWTVHNYLKYQPSAAQIRAKLAKDAARKKNANGERIVNGLPEESETTPHGIHSDSEGTPSLTRAPARAIPSRPVPSRPDPKAEEAAAARADPSLDEPGRLACVLMLAHEALAPGVGSIAPAVRAEVGAALHGRTVALRAEIDDGTTVQSLGDELVEHFVDVFRSDPGAREKGYPPAYLVTALRGDALGRAADLVRHAHGKPVSRSWKGPQPPMHNLLEGESPADLELTPEAEALIREQDLTGKTRTEQIRERRARERSR